MDGATRIMRFRGGRVQVKRPRKDGWTPRRRQLFLDRLAATCSVGEALAATGMGASSLYRLRKSDAAFAEAWEAALDAHFQEIEFALARLAKEKLLGHGAGNEAALAEAAERAGAEPGLALELLKARRMAEARERGGGGRRPIGGRVAVADKDALADKIMAKVRAARKRKGDG